MLSTQKIVLTVSQLNRQVKSWLEHELGVVSVAGEISNVSKPASGHFYFTLKDATAQLRCVYFKNRHMGADYNSIQNGQQVVAQGRLSLYEARGDYQLIVEHMEEAGIGDLYRQFELLKTSLAAIGLFDATRKKPLPRFPNAIGIITSPSGAAICDVLSTLARRFPVAEVVIYASDVQGKSAAPQLIKAIHQANAEQQCDVLILARGGGSIEDLWAFNDEHLAHAIAQSTIPIVSGVGHETDFTIADFVADLRAATPTAAAEAVTPNLLDLIAFFQTLEVQLRTAMNRHMQHQQLRLEHAIQKIMSPAQKIRTYWQTLDYLMGHLRHALQQILAEKRHALHVCIQRLEAKHPLVLAEQTKSQLLYLEQALIQQANRTLHHYKQQFTNLLATLNAVSPLATLERGYAIVTCHHHVLTDSKQVAFGDTLDIRLAKGSLVAKMIERE